MTTTQPTPPAPSRRGLRGPDATRRGRRRARGWTGSSSPRAGPGLAHRIPTHRHHRAADDARPAPDQEPTLLVPTLERPDAEAAVGAPRPHDRGLGRRRGPVREAGAYLRETATMGIADSAWAMHLLGLQEAVPGSSYRSLTQSLPMLRAVKDAASSPGWTRRAPPRTRRTSRSSESGSPAGRRPTSRPTWPGCCGSSGTSRSTSPWSAPAPTAPIRTTRPVTAPSRSATRSSSTSAD